MTDTIRALEPFNHRFFLKCLLENGDQIFLELEFNIDLKDDISPRLTEKSKEFLELWKQLTYESREAINKQLKELAEKLWGVHIK